MANQINPPEAFASRLPPIHPGEFIREELLPCLGLTIPELAKQIHVPLGYLHKLLTEEESITPHVAIGLGKLENIDPMLWMELQAAYDLWHASQYTPVVEGVVYGAHLVGSGVDNPTYIGLGYPTYPQGSVPTYPQGTGLGYSTVPPRHWVGPVIGYPPAEDRAAHSTARLIPTDQLAGTAVRHGNGNKIGTIERLVIDQLSGKIAYALISFGGFLGIGDEYRALPWSMLKYDGKFDAYELNLSQEHLRDAPAIAIGREKSHVDRRLEQTVHNYYHAYPYYW